MSRISTVIIVITIIIVVVVVVVVVVVFQTIFFTSTSCLQVWLLYRVNYSGHISLVHFPLPLFERS